MFLHSHPFEPIVFEDTKKLIVGTLPPPRFSIKDAPLKQEDVSFCYGSADNLLWRIIDKLYGLDLEFAPTQKAQKQRFTFLKKHKIGICDSVQECKRDKIDASDTGMQEILLRDITGIIRRYKDIDTLLLMGGSSRNSPEYFIKKILKKEGISLENIKKETPKIHRFVLEKREIKVVSLTSPSNAANRSIGANKLYKEKKAQNKNYGTLDFRIEQYREFF